MLNQHQTIRDNIAKYNKANPLIPELVKFIDPKRKTIILDVGSGPYSIIGDYVEGAVVRVIHCDNQDFKDFWKKYNEVPYHDIDYQDMEQLNYPPDFFDLVVCINALDHTSDAQKAVEEMIKVCRSGGHVYIDCHLDQKNTGHKHKWNMNEHGVMADETRMFDLKRFGFKINYIDNGGERRYNKVIAIYEKK